MKLYIKFCNFISNILAEFVFNVFKLFFPLITFLVLGLAHLILQDIFMQSAGITQLTETSWVVWSLHDVSAFILFRLFELGGACLFLILFVGGHHVVILLLTQYHRFRRLPSCLLRGASSWRIHPQVYFRSSWICWWLPELVSSWGSFIIDWFGPCQTL